MKNISLTLILLVFIFSCSNDNVSNTLDVPIKIITSDSESNILSYKLRVTYENNTEDFELWDEFEVNYNEVSTISLNLESDSFFFYLKDETYGYIEKRFTKIELEKFTKEAPLILDFNQHLSKVIFTANVKIPEISTKYALVDILVELYNTTLYHIDWGDGFEDTKESPNIYDAYRPESYIEHHYKETGIYKITVRASSSYDVKSVNINLEYNNKLAKIVNMQLNNLDNLDLLWIGDNEFEEVKSFLSTVPNLKALKLTRGKMSSIDLTQNLELEELHLDNGHPNGVRYNEIIGFYNLKKLKSIALRLGFNDIDLSKFPDLEYVNLGYYNGIKQLDISKNQKLRRLFIGSNPLTSLDLTSNPDLNAISLSNIYNYQNIDFNLDLSKQNKIDFLDLAWHNLTVTKLPPNLDYIKFLDISKGSFNINKIVKMLIEGQEKNPREKVKIIAKSRFDEWDNEDGEKFKSYKEDYNWFFSTP